MQDRMLCLQCENLFRQKEKKKERKKEEKLHIRNPWALIWIEFVLKRQKSTTPKTWVGIRPYPTRHHTMVYL